MSKGELAISRWLEAHSDRSAKLMTLPGNILLADIAGDGNHRLVLTDIKLEKDVKSRLKIYKGTLLITDQILPDIPSALICFYTDNLKPRIPAVGVACGHELLIYKNNKAYYKFSLPNEPLNPLEIELWKKLQDSKNVQETINELKSIPFKELSIKSQELLIQPNDKIPETINKNLNTKDLIKNSLITCMTTLNKNTQDKFAISCPIIGTESGNVFILDPQTFTILHHANICNTKSTPVIIRATGIFDVEFRIVIACREKNICLLRRDWVEGKCLVQLKDDIVDFVLVPGDNFIVIATSNKILHCYTKRGFRLWSVPMANSITCLCLVPLRHLSVHLIAVGLQGGSVQLYHGRQPVDYITVSDTPSALTFGQLGQEEHVLIIITLAGTMNFKILKRTADFNLLNEDKSQLPNLQTKPLPLPKRSKLFLEQSQREKQNPIDIHQNFQQDLVKLRLISARAFVQTLTNKFGTANEQEFIKISAQVLGIGPKFTLILNIENISTEKVTSDFTVVFHAKPTVYLLSTYIIPLPLIPAGFSYKIETKVTDIGDNQLISEKVIRVFVNKKGESQPILATIVNMPSMENY